MCFYRYGSKTTISVNIAPVFNSKVYRFGSKITVSVNIVPAFNRKVYRFCSKTTVSVNIMLIFNREVYRFVDKTIFSVNEVIMRLHISQTLRYITEKYTFRTRKREYVFKLKNYFAIIFNFLTILKN